MSNSGELHIYRRVRMVNSVVQIEHGEMHLLGYLQQLLVLHSLLGRSFAYN